MRYLWFAGLAACGLTTLALTTSPGGAQTKIDPRYVFVTPQQHARYLSLIPPGIFTDDELKRLVFYDAATARRAYQEWIGRATGGNSILGFHDPFYNVSGNGGERFGNANREFPWRTGGLDESDNGHSFKAVLLPPGDGPAGLEPIAGVKRKMRHTNGSYTDASGQTTFITNADGHPSWYGKHPVGTRLVEVLLVDSGHNPKSWDGWHVFEVRTMDKVADGDLFDVANNWRFRWFRGVEDSSHLLELVRDHAYHRTLQQHYTRPLGVRTLANPHPRTVINVRTIVDELPPMPPELFAVVHGRRFAEVTDRSWVKATDQSGDWHAYAGAGGPFPRGFQGGHFTTQVCMSCHRTAGLHAGDFQPFRDWYGRVSGGDGSFTTPYIDPRTVSPNGASRQPAWHAGMVSAGLLRPAE